MIHAKHHDVKLARGDPAIQTKTSTIQFNVPFLTWTRPMWHYFERPSPASLVLISLDPNVWSK